MVDRPCNINLYLPLTTSMLILLPNIFFYEESFMNTDLAYGIQLCMTLATIAIAPNKTLFLYQVPPTLLYNLSVLVLDFFLLEITRLLYQSYWGNSRSSTRIFYFSSSTHKQSTTQRNYDRPDRPKQPANDYPGILRYNHFQLNNFYELQLYKLRNSYICVYHL